MNPPSRTGSPGHDHVLAVDLGGSTVTGAVMTTDGEVRGAVRCETFAEHPDRSSLDLLTSVVMTLQESSVDHGGCPIALGLAVPGPFDLERGVSLMTHKLADLYDVPLGRRLGEATGIPTAFCNDAVAFALGAWSRQLQEETRVIGITLGTGIGSGFVVDGREATTDDRAPPGGAIWDLALGDGIVEDAVSRRALEASYVDSTGDPISVATMAARARQGDAAARASFSGYGRSLGYALALVVADFQPSQIVLGGGIANAFDLFATHAAESLHAATPTPTAMTAATDGEFSLAGIARHLVTLGLPGPRRRECT